MFDAMNLQVFANHTRATVGSMAYTLQRNARSAFVKETEDFTAMRINYRGDTFGMPRRDLVSGPHLYPRDRHGTMLLAGLFEIGYALSVGGSQAFTVSGWSVAAAIVFLLTLYFLSAALRTIDVGTGYRRARLGRKRDRRSGRGPVADERRRPALLVTARLVMGLASLGTFLPMAPCALALACAC